MPGPGLGLGPIVPIGAYCAYGAGAYGAGAWAGDGAYNTGAYFLAVVIKVSKWQI